MKIAVLGGGAMGALYGGYLSRKNDVTIVDVNTALIEKVKADGLKIAEPDGSSAVYHPAITSDTKGMQPVDLVIVFVKAMFSESALENALKAKLSEYRTENTISVEFTSPISISREIISADEQRSFAPVEDALDATSQEEVIYTVQAGDTWSEIAARYDMSSSELLALNPGFDIDKIWLDQELTVSAAVP